MFSLFFVLSGCVVCLFSAVVTFLFAGGRPRTLFKKELCWQGRGCMYIFLFFLVDTHIHPFLSTWIWWWFSKLIAGQIAWALSRGIVLCFAGNCLSALLSMWCTWLLARILVVGVDFGVFQFLKCMCGATRLCRVFLCVWRCMCVYIYTHIYACVCARARTCACARVSVACCLHTCCALLSVVVDRVWCLIWDTIKKKNKN